MTIKEQLLVSDVGTDDLGRTKTFVNVSENDAPKGSFSVTVSTVYNKARDPDAHLTRAHLHVASPEKLTELGQFLKDAAIRF